MSSAEDLAKDIESRINRHRSSGYSDVHKKSLEDWADRVRKLGLSDEDRDLIRQAADRIWYRGLSAYTPDIYRAEGQEQVKRDRAFADRLREVVEESK